MRIGLWMLFLCLGLTVLGCQGTSSSDEAMEGQPVAGSVNGSAIADGDDDDDDDENEVEIPLAQVPENVMNAALAAVPGISFQEAEKETENGQTVYELEGVANGVTYAVEVSSSGEVIEVEDGDDDDDNDDDDDGDDD